MKTVMKLLAALAAIAGAIYVIATYGEQIVAWCKQIWAKMPKCPCCEEAESVEAAEEETAEVTEETAEEAAAEEVSVEEAVEEAPEVVVAENEPVAAEEDFAE